MKSSSDRQIVAAEDTSIILEESARLSKCILWKLQRNFFEQQGIQAWREGVVPHYITSNANIASAYARVVFGFMRDCHRVDRTSDRSAFQPLDYSQPLYIIELGSGSGRFAFRFLKKFLGFYPRSVLKDLPFKFVMTDFTERNLEYWSAHPSLQYFVEEGVLDFARFDAEQSERIELYHSGDILSAETIKNPFVVLANYFFDSIPQDAFHIQDGKLHESLVTISSPQEEADLNDPEMLNRIEVSFESHPVSAQYYNDPDLDRILQNYQERLSATHILFPCAALKCIRRLRHLAGGRMLLISADKGYIKEDSLIGRAQPGLDVHGSFSMMVNYHAISESVQDQGGRVLQTSHRHTHLNICAFLFGSHPGDYIETRLAYDEAIERGGPDDFFTLKKGIEKNYDALSLEQLIAFLRLIGWDSKIFLDCFPSLVKQVESASEHLRQELHSTIQQVWETYYHIGEQRDIAFYMAMLFYGMNYYPEALEYFQHSLRLYGPDASTFYNMAMCHYTLRQLDAALECINQTLALDPTFEAAKGRRIKIESEVSHRTRQTFSG
jgi:tetratricopeptide (TPR) repeat protein